MIINPVIWYAERELQSVPPHFIKCPTPLSNEGIDWIKNKTTGRYSLCPANVDSPLSFKDNNRYNVFFESSADATIYELFWAGSNT